MISSELPEILGMSDRIAVMHAGTIAGVLSRERSDAGPHPGALALAPAQLTCQAVAARCSVAHRDRAAGVVLAVAAPGYFARENLNDLFLGEHAGAVVALGMTLVILTGEIDISVGSVFADLRRRRGRRRESRGCRCRWRRAAACVAGRGCSAR